MNQEMLFYKDYTLPSNGKIYNKIVNPNVTLRGLNKLEVEIFKSLKETSYTELSYLIDAALEKTLNIPSIELALIDFEFLLFKLRILTFGYEYDLISTCPKCHTINKYKINISGLDLKEINCINLNEITNVILPKSNNKLELRYMTVKEIDEISKKDNKDLLNIIFSIKKVNDKVISINELEIFISELGLFDKRILNKAINDMYNSFGINKCFKVNCGKCKNEYKGFFFYTLEFFNPNI